MNDLRPGQQGLKDYALKLAKKLDELPRQESPHSRNVLVVVVISDAELRKIAADLRRNAGRETVET